jgi:hypothetical protein
MAKSKGKKSKHNLNQNHVSDEALINEEIKKQNEIEKSKEDLPSEHEKLGDNSTDNLLKTLEKAIPVLNRRAAFEKAHPQFSTGDNIARLRNLIPLLEKQIEATKQPEKNEKPEDSNETKSPEMKF